MIIKNYKETLAKFDTINSIVIGYMVWWPGCIDPFILVDGMIESHAHSLSVSIDEGFEKFVEVANKLISFYNKKEGLTVSHDFCDPLFQAFSVSKF